MLFPGKNHLLFVGSTTLVQIKNHSSLIYNPIKIYLVAEPNHCTVEATKSIIGCSPYFQAIEQSLRSMHLLAGGVPDKLVGKYSGGMKRRLSVAISLIGDPKVFLFIN